MIPPLKIHEKFLLALDQFQKMLADLDDPRRQMSVGTGSLESNYQIPPDKDFSPPESPRVRCTDVGLAQTFGTIMDRMNPLQARAVRYHFLISSYSQYTEAWETVASNESRYFKTPVLEYVKLIQDGVNHIAEKL